MLTLFSLLKMETTLEAKRIYIYIYVYIVRCPVVVYYKDIYSDWKLDLFASLRATTSYNMPSTVITV
jgi:hypothetical protein